MICVESSYDVPSTPWIAGVSSFTPTKYEGNPLMCSSPASADEENVRSGEASRRNAGEAKEPASLTVGLEKSNVNVDDAVLAERLAHGEHDAMQILVDRYRAHVFRIARRWLVDSGEAKDMVQEIFLEAFRDIAAFDAQRGSFKAWLLTKAHSRTINRRHHLEAQGFYNSVALPEHLLDQATDNGHNRLGLLPPELSQLTAELFVLLEPRERQVITLTYERGLTREQVADDLGVTVAAVKHSLQKGLKILYLAITASGNTRIARDDSKGKEASVD